MEHKELLLSMVSVFAFLLVGCTTSTVPGGDYSAFAKCLTENNVKMYGAFWCPHCQAQEEMFGKDFENINYIECSLPDKSSQTQICDAAGIKAYPTWEFADGKRIEGKMTFQQLSEFSGCSLSGKSKTTNQRLVA